MKKLLTLFVLLFACTQIQAQGVKFEEGLTMQQIMAKAEEQGKPIFIDVYTTWCGPCKYMTESVFPTAEAGEYFNATFINAKIDAEKGEGIELAKKYKVTGYPTFLIIDSKGNELGRVVGAYKPVEGFLRVVKENYKKPE